MIEKCFREFDPYLCNAVLDSLSELAGMRVLIEKSNLVVLVNHLKRQYRENPEFARVVKEALFAFDSIRIKDPDMMRRIRDINLLYLLKFSCKPPLKIKGKVTGRALELVVESVLKSRLDLSRFDWEFVDWKGFDYMILDKDRNDWIAGIQCKTAFVGGFLSYQKELTRLKDFIKYLPMGKTLIMFCGMVPISKKEEVKHAFENEGWEVYYFWKDIKSYEIDESFYEFMDRIERVV